jgi:hypothetical protein
MRFMVYGEGPYENKLAWDEPPFNCEEKYHHYGAVSDGVDTDQWGGLIFYCFPEDSNYRRIVAYWATGRWVWFKEIGEGWPQNVVDIFESEGEGTVTNADTEARKGEAK